MDTKNKEYVICYCNVCDKYVMVTVPEHEDLMSVIYSIEDKHKETSPKCNNDVRNLVVIN